MSYCPFSGRLRTAAGLSATAVVALALALPVGAPDAQSASEDRNSAAPGKVCVGTRGFGVACLKGGNWVRWTRNDGALASDFVYAIAACHGRIVVSTGRRLHEFAGENRHLMHWTPGSPARRIACDPTGGYWISGGRTLAKWTGRTWLSHSIDKVLAAARAGWIDDLTVERNGHLWVVAGNRIAARFDGGTWRHFMAKAGLPARWRLTGVHAGRGGLWLAHDRGLARRQGGSWVNVPGPGSAQVIAEAPDGALWLGYYGRITRYRNEFWTRFTAAAPVRGLAADDSGRVWAATRYGLGVYGGGKWRWRRMADSAFAFQRSGRRGRARQRIPAAAAARQTAGQSRLPPSSGLPAARWQTPGSTCGAAPPGRILQGGRSPCHGRPLHRISKTDGNGHVTFGNLPAADYFPAVLPPEGERWLIGVSGRRTRVTAGRRSDLGTLRIRAADENGPAR